MGPADLGGHHDHDRVGVRIPADIDAPDKVAYGLTFRQLAILAVGGVLFYIVWSSLHRVMPLLAMVIVGVVLGGVTFGLAVGRRDGLPLDRWLLYAVRHHRAPTALSTLPPAPELPEWIEAPRRARTVLPAPLRLPADTIGDDGTLHLGDTCAAVVAATTVNLGLRTAAEQAALVDTFGRWLNSLSAPTQVVVSAQPVDLGVHARALAEVADALPTRAMAAACRDHSRFLTDLSAARDPLRRQVLVVTAGGGPGDGSAHAARRRADDAVRALSGLGVDARTLNGAAVTAALSAAADPYQPPRPAAAARPGSVTTGRAQPDPWTGRTG